MKPRIKGFTVEYNGSEYTYNIDMGSWRIDGKLAYPRDVPNEVKASRESIIDAVSQLD